MPGAVGYTVSGSGPLVVLVHGLGEDGHSWDHQRAALSDRYRVVAYDVRGHGRTPIGSADGTLAQLGTDLVGILDELGGTPATLVGYSLGGTIVLWVAATRPELVDGVVAVATSSVVGSRAADFYRERIALVREHDAERLRNAIADDTRAGFHRQELATDEVVERHLEAMGDGAGYCNAAAAMMRLREEPLTPLLSQVRCPVLVVGGEHDAFCPRKAQEILLEALPAADYREIEGVGHQIGYEAPEALTAVLADFLDEVNGVRRGGAE